MSAIVELAVPQVDKKIKVNTGLFINNAFVPSLDQAEPIKCNHISLARNHLPLIPATSESSTLLPKSSCAPSQPVRFSSQLNSARYPVLTTCPPASEKDVDAAVAAARAAFKTTWGKNVSGFERSRLMHKLADLMERDQEELAQLECLNNGKPVKVAR